MPYDELAPREAGGWTDRPPVCCFCGEPWSAEMVKLFDVSMWGGCDTCGHGAAKSGTIQITCDKCEKLIYQKDYTD